MKYNPRFVVDGVAEDDTYQGDGENAPFVVFDVELQRNLPGEYTTRAEAQRVATNLEYGDEL